MTMGQTGRGEYEKAQEGESGSGVPKEAEAIKEGLRVRGRTWLGARRPERSLRNQIVKKQREAKNKEEKA